MDNRSSLQETKHHGEVRFPFNIYPCTIPGDFRQVAVHWQDSMELVYIKRGSGLVQTGAQVCTAQSGDIFVLTPGTLHAIRQTESCTMEYENIIFELELLGGAGDICAEKYLLPVRHCKHIPDLPVHIRCHLCRCILSGHLPEVQDLPESAVHRFLYVHPDLGS